MIKYTHSGASSGLYAPPTYMTVQHTRAYNGRIVMTKSKLAFFFVTFFSSV